jgi:hypothetical protein
MKEGKRRKKKEKEISFDVILVVTEKEKEKELTKTHVRTTAADGDHVVKVEFGGFVAHSFLRKVVQRLAGR